MISGNGDLKSKTLHTLTPPSKPLQILYTTFPQVVLEQSLQLPNAEINFDCRVVKAQIAESFTILGDSLSTLHFIHTATSSIVSSIKVEFVDFSVRREHGSANGLYVLTDSSVVVFGNLDLAGSSEAIRAGDADKALRIKQGITRSSWRAEGTGIRCVEENVYVARAGGLCVYTPEGSLVDEFSCDVVSFDADADFVLVLDKAHTLSVWLVFR